MAVGTIRAFVIDVNDLEVGERFWCAVTGFDVLFSGWADQFSGIGTGHRFSGIGTGQFSGLGTGPSHSMLLQLVPETKTDLKNRAHIDITVEDVDHAINEVITLGGSLIRPKGGHPPDAPELEWAVMTDPFGNEFCVIRDL